jgi:hypothetical protein
MDHHIEKQRQNSTNKYKISEKYRGESKMEETGNFNPKHVNRDRRETTNAWPCKKNGQNKDTIKDSSSKL